MDGGRIFCIASAVIGLVMWLWMNHMIAGARPDLLKQWRHEVRWYFLIGCLTPLFLLFLPGAIFLASQCPREHRWGLRFR